MLVKIKIPTGINGFCKPMPSKRFTSATCKKAAYGKG